MTKFDRKMQELPAEVARRLRREQTLAEATLWKYLRDNQIGAKFRRQQHIKHTPYVADFCCVAQKLIIELDGGIHGSQVEADQQRQAEIEALGYQFWRFSNEQVFQHLDHVLKSIHNTLLDGI